ncbi:MAG TPA: hypothetical protein VGO22_16305 [Pseudorhizobium sp.]|nr:hypothetical protein [Pseudorhizobium sp.]
MPHIAQLYFNIAIVFLIVGLGMGLQMGIPGNDDVIGAHAHANLLGRVAMALFGNYYAFCPAKAVGRLASLQYWIYTAGVIVMVPSLYMLLRGHTAFEPLVGTSSLVVFLGALLFAAILFNRARAPAAKVLPDAASS